MAIYGYARISTGRQENSLDGQERQIRGFVTQRFHCEPDQIFREDGVSGGKAFATRPEGKALIRQLRRGDAVIITKLDRGFRNTADALATAAQFRHAGIALHLLDINGEDVAADTGTGALIFTILAAIAEFERDRMRERQRDGFAQKRLQGKAITNTPQFGWRIGPDRDLIEVPEQQRIIAEIQDYHAAGFSNPAIRTALARRGIKMSARMVQNILIRAKAQADGTPLPVGYYKQKPRFGFMRNEWGDLVEDPEQQLALQRVEELIDQGLDNKAIVADIAAHGGTTISLVIVARLRHERTLKPAGDELRTRRGRLSFGWRTLVDGGLREEDWMPELRHRQAAGQSLAQLREFLAGRGIEASRQTIMRALRSEQ
jgi:DNA invertase Pin-like site-specific DNA recombinase